MPSTPYLHMERNIALAHQALARAESTARVMGGYGTADDLFDLMVEVQRVQEALLRGLKTKAREPRSLQSPPTCRNS